jgi:hypothetical protein
MQSSSWRYTAEDADRIKIGIVRYLDVIEIVSRGHVVRHSHDPKQSAYTDLVDAPAVEHSEYFCYGFAHMGFELIGVHDGIRVFMLVGSESAKKNGPCRAVDPGSVGI